MPARIVWLGAVVLIVGCGRRSEPVRKPPKDAALQHDETKDDENHYFISVDRDRFGPSVLNVPRDTELILQFYFAAGTPCTGITIDPGLPTSITRDRGPQGATHVASNLDIHARLGPGSHEVRCNGGISKGIIDAR